MRAKGHAYRGPVVTINSQKNSDCISAFFILTNVFEFKRLSLFRLPLSSLVRIRNQRLAPFLIRQHFKEFDNGLQGLWIHRDFFKRLDTLRRTILSRKSSNTSKPSFKKQSSPAPGTQGFQKPYPPTAPSPGTGAGSAGFAKR